MNQLQIINHANQRVLTTAQLASSFGTGIQIITNNFNRNKDRYTIGKHFIALSDQEKRDFLNQHQIDLGSKNASILYLWTEKGAWMHAKSLNTDQAWDAYEMLVDDYYSIKEVPLATSDRSADISNPDKAGKMINFLRVSIRDGFLDGSAEELFRRQIAEQVTGKSYQEEIRQLTSEAVVQKRPTDEYTGRWYLTKEVAVIAGASVNLIGKLASKYDVRVEDYCKSFPAEPDKHTGLIQLKYNEKGKDRLVQLVKDWYAAGNVSKVRKKGKRK